MKKPKNQGIFLPTAGRAERIGYVYVATNEENERLGLYKIGSAQDVKKRMEELSRASGVTSLFYDKYAPKMYNYKVVEKRLHSAFDYCRNSNNREFFEVDWRAVRAALQMAQTIDIALLSDLDVRKEERSGKIYKHSLIKWVIRGNAENARRALSIGANPNLIDKRAGMTVLMIAAGCGGSGHHAGLGRNIRAGNADEYADIVDALLEKGADPDKICKTSEQTTPLMEAIYDADVSVVVRIVEMLLAAGADVNIADIYGLTALIIATDRYGADVYGPDAPEGVVYTKIVKMLLKVGADVNAYTKLGHTALMAACQHGNTDRVKLLLEAGANPNMKTRYGDTALKIAERMEFMEIIHLLRQHGAKE